jgi:hypothetical protein
MAYDLILSAVSNHFFSCKGFIFFLFFGEILDFGDKNNSSVTGYKEFSWKKCTKVATF